MKLVVQRTGGAEVLIDGESVAKTGPGLLVLFGTRTGDQTQSCGWLADKLVNLRIFEDKSGKMNLSALDLDAEILIVSQFTLYADCRKGRRPAFTEAMAPEEAEKLYDRFVELVSASGLKTETGRFGAKMELRFNNLGPVTIIVEHDGE